MNALSLSNRDQLQPLAQGRLPELDQLLDRVFSGFDFAPPLASHRGPAVQVDENDREFQVTVDLPGVATKDVELSFNDGTLTLKAQREISQNTRYSTRWSGTFERSIELGQDVDVDHIGAALKNGVLTVTLPKKPELQPRRIQIE